MSNSYDVLVIGGGVNGLATAYQLSQHKKLKIGLVEQFSLGHSRGSSHGLTRIFRSTYVNPVYVSLAKHARDFEWPALEQASGIKLLHPNRRCIFGHGTSYEEYAESILKNCPDVEKMSSSAARQLFPEFHFNGSPYVLNDPSAAIIAARATVESLKQLIPNVTLHENTKVLSIDTDQDPIRITTSKEDMRAEKLVITAGPWISQLVPSQSFQSVRQVVSYFKLKGSSFPLWEYAGEGLNQVFYGLPELCDEGIKISQEVIDHKADDPDEEREIDLFRKKVLEEFIATEFTQQIERGVSDETCFYTMTPTSDFVLDLLEPRIAIGSACSGHGFKFAPLTGKILTELVLFDQTSIPEFEENKSLFAMKG